MMIRYKVLHTQCMPLHPGGRCGMGSLDVWRGLSVSAHSSAYRLLVKEGATLETHTTQDVDEPAHRWRLWDWPQFPPLFLRRNYEVMVWRRADEAKFAAQDVDEQTLL